MDFSRLSYGKVRDMSSQLSSSANSMANILNEVEAQFNKIGDEGTWSGTAAAEVKAEFDTLKSKFGEFSQAIADCSAYLNNVVANYEAADKALTQK